MAPYSRILVTAGALSVPGVLLEQLEVGGIMVIPVGPEGRDQDLLRITKTAADRHTEEKLGMCQFVPFREGLA